MKCWFITVFLAAAISVPAVRAIEIADGFTYAEKSGFEASHALATDFSNYPVFEAVGSLNIFLGDEKSLGSGTLLNSEWILTAGHCWDADVTDLQFVLSGVAYQIDMDSIFLHPLWTDAPAPLRDADVGPSQGWDLALFKLASPITNSITYPQLYTKSDELGKVSVTLGAGDIGTGTMAWEAQDNDPALVYAAFNIVDRVTSQTNSGYGGGFLVADFDGTANYLQNTLSYDYNTRGDPWVWDVDDYIVVELDPEGEISGNDSSRDQFTQNGDILEGATAPGDSGGPTFIEDAGEWKLAGVTSWGHNPWDSLYNGSTNERGLYGDVNYMVRVSEANDWIYSVIPEPSTWALLLLGGLGVGIVCSRQRKSS